MQISSLQKDKILSAGEDTSLLQKLLLKRGITDAREIEAFLNPDYDAHTHDPFLLKDMDKAVDRILEAFRKNEKIIIYSDYDTDGIPGGAMFHSFLKKIGYANFENYIPHRNNEGYSLNKKAIEQFSKEGASLIITIDCGITDISEVEYARELGIDVVVTDHHLPLATLPPAYAIINPNRDGDTYPFKGLCGTAVAFKYIQAVIREGKKAKIKEIRELSSGWEKWLLDLVAIATVSDMVPLVGENRVFAYWGLRVLQKSRRLGIMHLLRTAGVDQRYLTEEDIGFVIGPRINVASRIDVPAKAFQLLTTDDMAVAGLLVEELNGLNEKRKGLVASVIKEAKQRISRQEIREVIVMGNLNWHPGILGLAAHRLMTEHKRPVFLWGEGGGGIKGSCRSDGKINIVELMSHTEDIWEDFGGHESSGGFTVIRRSLHVLEEQLSVAYGKVPKKENTENAYDIDGGLSLEDVSWSTYHDLASLAPFGRGNPRPIFLFENVDINEVKLFGKRKEHLTLVVGTAQKGLINAIQFFGASAVDEFSLEAGARISFIAHIEQNFFRRRGELRLRIVEIRD